MGDGVAAFAEIFARRLSLKSTRCLAPTTVTVKLYDADAVNDDDADADDDTDADAFDDEEPLLAIILAMLVTIHSS